MIELLDAATDLVALKALDYDTWRATIWQLVVAQKTSTGLSRELPIPADGYRHMDSAKGRLERIARNATRHHLAAYIIKSLESQDAIGMATAMLSGVPTSDEYKGGVELSYWTSDSYKNTETGQAIGSALVGRLAEVPGAARSHGGLWTVTLPDDQVKADVWGALDFQTLGPAQRYDIDDKVEEPRQLWVRPYDLRLQPEIRA